MTFLNLALLGGAAALAVPILIHLLSRRRYTPVAWGAMFLIEQVVRQNRRRVRVEQWILLAVRCAIPVLIALAMARPVMTGWRALAGDEPTSAVVVLDASYSMSAPTPAGGSARDAARQAVAGVLSRLPKGSDAKLLIAGSGTRLLDAGGSRLPDVAGIDWPAAEFGPADAPAAIAEARSLLAKSPHRRREVVLVSDFQKLNWAAAPLPAAGRNDGLAPELTFVHVATAPAANAVVEDVTLSPALAGVNRPVRVRAALRNAGDRDLADVPVRLTIDGVARGESRLNLSAGATSEANFVTSFDAPGAHAVEVVVGGDALPADNVFRLALDVPEAIPVLLVGPQTDLPFPQNPTDFLGLALDPAAASSGVELSSLLRPTVVRADALSGRSLAEARVVVLANVGKLTDSQGVLLREFVRGGGGLIVFPGERTDVGWFNAQELMPARLASLRGGAAAGGETRLVGPPYAHAALLPWNDPGSGRLGEATLRRWYALQPRPGAATLVTTESGEPFLVEQPANRGTVIVAATAADTQWSDLPLRASFLPLVQQLAAYAAGRSVPPRTVWAGEPLAMPVDPGEGDQFVIVAPDGTRHGVTPTVDRGRTVVRFAETAQPGFYRLIRAAAADAPLATFAVNAPRAESDLEALGGEELKQLAAAQGATLVGGAAGYAEHDQDRRFGREAWRWAWVGALALLFGELLLQGWFATRGLKGGPA